RDKHGRHDERDRDDGAADLFHRREGGLAGGEPFFLHLDVHRFHDDNRVIDDNTDGQYQCEEGQQVDGETHDLHEKQRSDQRHGYGQRGNQCPPEILEEDKHHQGHEQDRFEKGSDHLGDRRVEEPGDVVRKVIGHPRRETRGFDLFHPFLDAHDHIAGVRARPLVYEDGGSRGAVVLGNTPESQRAEFDFGDILEPQDRAVIVGAQHEVFVFFRCVELTGIQQYVLQVLRCFIRALAGFSRRRLDVLRFNPFEDFFRRDRVRRHAVGFQPDAHAIVFFTHNLRIPDAVNTFEFLQDVDVGEVVNEFFIQVGIGTDDVDIHQETVHLLFRDHPVLDDFFREFVDNRGHAVLHGDGRDIGVDPHGEGHVDHHRTVVTRHGRHVRHPGYAVDRFLQRNGYRFGTYLRVRATVFRPHRYGRRNDIRILCDRQGKEGQYPQ